jgi:hypothetical protein
VNGMKVTLKPLSNVNGNSFNICIPDQEQGKKKIFESIRISRSKNMFECNFVKNDCVRKQQSEERISARSISIWPK